MSDFKGKTPGLFPDSMFILNLIFLIYKIRIIILYILGGEKSK